MLIGALALAVLIVWLLRDESAPPKARASRPEGTGAASRPPPSSLGYITGSMSPHSEMPAGLDFDLEGDHVRPYEERDE